MDMTLYEIAGTYRQALEKLVDEELPADAVTDTLDGLRGDLNDVATNVAMIVQCMESLADQIELAQIQMDRRRKNLETRAQAIRDYIKGCMETAGVTQIECPYFRLRIHKNPPAVEIEDESLIPLALQVVPDPPAPRPDKKQIAEVITGGGTVPGARLIQRTRLVIK